MDLQIRHFKTSRYQRKQELQTMNELGSALNSKSDDNFSKSGVMGLGMDDIETEGKELKK